MGQTLDNTIFKVRADSKGNWQQNNPTLATRELTVDLTECDFKVGTDGGSTAWGDTNYLIARNATVTAARNTATNAQNTANSAQETANQALQIAQNASGRYVDYSLNDYYDHKDFQFTEDILREKKNTEYEINKGACESSSFEFDYSGPQTDSNVIKLRFITGDSNNVLKSQYFSPTPSDGTYCVVLEEHGDPSNPSAVVDFKTGIISLAAKVYVEVEILNGIWFKVEVTKLLEVV